MARVSQHRNGRQNAFPPGVSKANQTAKNRRRQKVVLEDNAPGQNNTRTMVRDHHSRPPRGRAHQFAKLSFKADPPPGYTFIPAGNPQLTNALKEAARQGNHKIMSVSVSYSFVCFTLD